MEIKKQENVVVSIPLQIAKFCVECEVIFNENGKGECPICGSNSTIYLKKWLNKDV